MEHLLLALVALVSFVRSHLRLYHPPPVHHSYKAIFCTWKSLLFWGSNILYPVTVNTEHHSILSILVSRTSNSTKTWSVYPGLASTFLELKRQHPDEIRNLCPRNLHDSKRFRRILFLWPFTGYFGFRIVEAGSLKTLKRIVEKCNVSGWKRKSLQGLIEWNLESDTVIGDMDIEMYR